MTSEKILAKIFRYDFTLKKPTVYDHRKYIGQDFWIRLWKHFYKHRKKNRAILKVLINEKLIGIDTVQGKKDAIFLNEILWKITGNAVLDNLNCKIFLIS